MSKKLQSLLTSLKNKIKRVDGFREYCKDELAKTLNTMSDYTTLDDIKSALITNAINIAISYVPVVGGITVSLTATQVKTLSKQVIIYGHKAEKLMAIQLERHNKMYEEIK